MDKWVIPLARLCICLGFCLAATAAGGIPVIQYTTTSYLGNTTTPHSLDSSRIQSVGYQRGRIAIPKEVEFLVAAVSLREQSKVGIPNRATRQRIQNSHLPVDAHQDWSVKDHTIADDARKPMRLSERKEEDRQRPYKLPLFRGKTRSRIMLALRRYRERQLLPDLDADSSADPKPLVQPGRGKANKLSVGLGLRILADLLRKQINKHSTTLGVHRKLINIG